MEGKPLLGIFDSGVGGFSVCKKVRAVTDANCIYYGDTRNAPYGNKPNDVIVGYIEADIIFLQEKGVTHFVNACNSMSVLTTDMLLAKMGIKPTMYVDMIRAFDTYADFLSTDSVLVFATQATITSGIYQTVLEQKKVITYTYIFEHLAYAIENSLSRDELLQQIVPAMQYAKEKDVTHIVYGCTHYPLIHTVFVEAAQRVGWDGTYIDPAVYVGKLVASWKLSGERSFCPYASKDTPAFIRESIMFL